MNALELRIPPLLLLLIVAALMWMLPLLQRDWGWAWAHAHWLAAALTLIGASIAWAGVRAFAAHETTVNPLQPESSTRVVSSGIYRWSRNPMYLGMALALAGWAVWLQHPLPWLLLPVFVGWLDRWQIRPEERAL